MHRARNDLLDDDLEDISVLLQSGSHGVVVVTPLLSILGLLVLDIVIVKSSRVDRLKSFT